MSFKLNTSQLLNLSKFYLVEGTMGKKATHTGHFNYSKNMAKQRLFTEINYLYPSKLAGIHCFAKTVKDDQNLLIL